jgi:hypothetical protein
MDKVKEIIEQLRRDLADPSTTVSADYRSGYADALTDIEQHLDTQEL